MPVISCMGTGNKFHPERFEVTDISKTSVCPLAKVMRKELKVRGIKNVKVVYSKEEPQKPAESPETGKRQIPGSLSFVPPVAGLLLAGESHPPYCRHYGLKWSRKISMYFLIEVFGFFVS